MNSICTRIAGIKAVSLIFFVFLLANISFAQSIIQFVYTSDLHYGITRANFQGDTTVNAKTVNAALIAKINTLPTLTIPSDGGINAGNLVGGIDYVINTGDISNREEAGIQGASASWAQFKTDYIDSLKLTNNSSQKSTLLLLPGNHDVSNAIGYYKTMSPLKDSSVMVNIYSLMMPSTRPDGNYDYPNEKIHYSKDISGIHFMFVNMWPDSVERIWMTNDLSNVSATTPVVIFTHDQPLVESKHFTNPNGTHNINSTDKFENLLLETFKDGTTITPAATIEQRTFASFVKLHPNIVAYFHGNDNANEFYTYYGPDSTIALNTFRVDSPMKGNVSATDETKLSFHLVNIDTKTMKMTARECLWNTVPTAPSTPIVFGASKTVSLAVPDTTIIQFVYTSDSHYGITRAAFQGGTTVNAKTVHAALVAKINTLPTLTIPSDGGINAGNVVGGIDYVINTGDISNREEAGIQGASASWAQFKTDYIDSLKLTNNSSQKSTLLLLPGNHDVSNAIGYYKTMSPLKDSSVMVNIYSLMMPSTRPDGNYDYPNEKIHYSKDISGIHFMFVNMWPDSVERIWMTNDLSNVSATTPVVIFTHDQPLVESKHFTNPNGTHNINSTDKFENLLLETFKDGTTITPAATIEQRTFASFVKLHPNIVAYFHGNDNANEFYTYYGPDSTIALNTFRVDSPMKGNVSATDETKLSFHLVNIDTKTMKMTARECLWNTVPTAPSTPIVFGASKTVSLIPQGVTTAIAANEHQSVSSYALQQNYPNPFNPSTTISFALPFESKVNLAVYNVVGEVVKELVNETVSTGYRTVHFDASSLSSGVYFYALKAVSLDGKQNYKSVKKMILIK